jgi:hypothetical protein
MFWKGADNGNFNVKESWAVKPNAKPMTPVEKQLNDYKKKLPVPVAEKKKDDMSDMLDEEMSKRVLKNFQDEGLFKKRENPILVNNVASHGSKNALPKAKDNDIVATMAARLTKTELTAQSQREEIKEKSVLIERLQKEVSLLRVQANGNDEIFKTKEENEKLKQQIIDMEKFLNDYGLKWVGHGSVAGKKEGNLDVKAINKDIDSQKLLYKINLPKEIDIVVLERRVQELNFTIEKEGIDEIVKGDDGAHRFKKKEPVPLAFYKNGMVIAGFPFALYSSKEAMEAMQDILDGYFPTMLKSKFPNACLFKFINKIDEDYSTKAFEGRMHGFASIDEQALRPQTKEEFLANLPKNIIKDGKIISVRDEIAKKFVPNGAVDTKRTDAAVAAAPPGGIVEIETALALKEKGSQLSPRELQDMTTLKVRSENGKYQVIIKLSSKDTIATVYNLLKTYSETKKFELSCNYPPQTFPNDLRSTLDELGLHPSSALQMKPVAH